MFNNSKYTTWYHSIIEAAKTRHIEKPYERHHIIPRCMNGTDTAENIVKLTPREHFICHMLLVKMVDSTYKSKLAYASWQQSRSFKYSGKVTSKIYDMIKRELSSTYIGRKRAPFSDEWIENMRIGAKNRKKIEYSSERLDHIRKLGESSKGKQLSQEHRDKIGNSVRGKSYEERYGKDTAKELREIRRQQQLDKPIVTCPHCGKQGKGSGMWTWHFDKCKDKN